MEEQINTKVVEVAKNISNTYNLDIAKIERNELNVLIYPDDLKKDLSGLVADIEANGLDAAITVVKKDDKYICLSGHGRTDAARTIYEHGGRIMYHGKQLEQGKIPCNIHPAFESKEDEMEYIICCNASKNGGRNGKHVFDITCRLYQTKVNNHQINPKEKSLEQYVMEITGISRATFFNYKKEDESTNVAITPTKIKKVSEVLKDIDKAIKLIEDIQMEEYGKTDKETIKQSLANLIAKVKTKK